MSQGEADEIIGQITDATVHLLNRNLDLVQQMVKTGGTSDGAAKHEGPAQGVWTAWTESAGDLVQITYLTAQLVDSVWGRRPPPAGDG